MVVKERELRACLGSLQKKPKLVVTDSQVFLKVAADTPPDVMMTLTCAGGQSTNTSTVESYQPAWCSGGCAATGRALRDSGIVWRLDDVDVTTNDTITANVPTLFPESVISSGEGQVSNVNAAIKVTFRITKN